MKPDEWTVRESGPVAFAPPMTTLWGLFHGGKLKAVCSTEEDARFLKERLDRPTKEQP